MSDILFAVLIFIGFVWGFATAKAMTFFERLDREREEREANQSAYMRQRHVRIYGDEWGDNAGA